MIEQYKLDLHRHAFNTPFTGEPGQTLRNGFEENDFWRFREAWYGTLDCAHKKYPKRRESSFDGGKGLFGADGVCVGDGRDSAETTTRSRTTRE